MRPPRLEPTPLFDQFIEEIGKKKSKGLFGFYF